MQLNKKNLGIMLIIVLIIGGGLWFYFTNKNGADKNVTNQSYDSFLTNEPVINLNENNTNTIEPLNNTTTMPIVKIETNKGDITLELFSSDAPKTVDNFISLANKGFYDGVIFHRVISGFMIQGGDPTGTGTGGPGYKFADELDPVTESYQRGYVRGTLAMANSGPNTNGSQFFIMHQDYALPNKYTIFGQVVSGLETVDAIAAVAVNANDKPLDDVIIKKVTVLE